MKNRIRCLAFLLCIAVGLLGLLPFLHAQEGGGFTVLYAQLESGISPAQVDLLDEALDEAGEIGADMLLLRLDTPGGLGESMRDMVRLILNSRVPVAVWVGPAGARAASAGVFIVAASSVAAMSPQTTIGAASPVMPGGGDIPATMEKKVKSDILSLLRGVAAARGRNVEWFEQAVEEAVSVTAEEAVMLRVVEMIASSPRDFLIQIGSRGLPLDGTTRFFSGEDARLVDFEPGFRYRFLSWLLDPQVAYFLLLGGLAGLFFELTTPGAILPGVVGSICLLLGLYALAILPTNVAGLLLILLGLVLFILEIWVVSYGMLSVAAIACLFIGSLILFRFEPGGAGLLPFRTVIVTVGGVSLLLGAAVYLAARAQVSRHASGTEALVGRVGTVRVWNGDLGRGQIFVDGALWAARCSGPPGLAPGQAVRVVEVKGLTLTVVPADADEIEV